MNKRRLFLGVLAFAGLALAGCTTPNAGGQASGITITINATRFSGPGPTEAFVKIEGDGNGTATAAPETGSQSTNGATVSPTVDLTPGQ